MKELFLLRGIPGSGKSSLAESLGGVNFEADQYFMKDGDYRFDPTQLKEAHQFCQAQTEAAMQSSSERVIVSNTFTQEWEMEPYFEFAKKYGYRVYSLIVENRHGGVNTHGVPSSSINSMADRFEFKLK